MALPNIDNLEIDVRSPRALQLYLELVQEEADWQATVDEVRRRLNTRHPNRTPRELRELVATYIPDSHSLSDAVIAMRDE